MFKFTAATEFFFKYQFKTALFYAVFLDQLDTEMCFCFICEGRGNWILVKRTRSCFLTDY